MQLLFSEWNKFIQSSSMIFTRYAGILLVYFFLNQYCLFLCFIVIDITTSNNVADVDKESFELQQNKYPSTSRVLSNWGFLIAILLGTIFFPYLGKKSFTPALLSYFWILTIWYLTWGGVFEFLAAKKFAMKKNISWFPKSGNTGKCLLKTPRIEADHLFTWK